MAAQPNLRHALPLHGLLSHDDRLGEMFKDAEDAIINAGLAELNGPINEEHPDVALSHEAGQTLSAFPSGLATP